LIAQGQFTGEKSIDLLLREKKIRELPLILGIWLKFLLRLICECG